MQDREDAGAPDPRKTVWLLGLAGAGLCYLAHPPVDWSLLGWIGPAPWLMLARTRVLPGRRPLRALWIAGTVFWLAAAQWLRLPHPLNHLAWILIAIYLGGYLPLIVRLTQVGVHRWGAPLWIVGPAVWTGLELVRAHLLTGFLMASLAHTQAEYPAMIQIASLGGEYAVTFLMVLVAAAIAEAAPLAWIEGRTEGRTAGRKSAWQLGKLVPAVVACVLVGAFGKYRLLTDYASGPADRTVQIAIVQSDLPAAFKGDRARDQQVMQQQERLSLQAAAAEDGRKPAVIVWAETMFRMPWFTLDESFDPETRLPSGKEFEAAGKRLRELASQTGAALLVGIERVNLLPDENPRQPGSLNIEVYNSSVFISSTGEMLGTYDKMHLLPLGEYVPLVAWLPILRNLTPITGNASPGAGPTGIEYRDVIYAPNICYETVLPHVIRGQVTTLCEQGRAPDVLVNLTNDAWYWGSSELDMHLASGVFRAVEMDTPLIVAANRGLSAHVDRRGKIVAVSQRNTDALLSTEVQLQRGVEHRSRPPTLYARWGDWLPALCLAACAALAWTAYRRPARTPLPGD